jgi:excisionase family DNA binding protein
VADTLSTGEAARRLCTSKPTVIRLIKTGALTAVQEPRGSRFIWRIDPDSVELYISTHGRFDKKRRQGPTRLEKLEAEVSELREKLDALQAVSTGNVRSHSQSLERKRVEAERDELRARVVTLEETLVRLHEAAELQRQVDEQRAEMVRHVLSAVEAGERADELRRRASAELEEALAATGRPGHPGHMP